jgi:hypothetical protein
MARVCNLLYIVIRIEGILIEQNVDLLHIKFMIVKKITPSQHLFLSKHSTDNALHSKQHGVIPPQSICLCTIYYYIYHNQVISIRSRIVCCPMLDVIQTLFMDCDGV